MVPIHETRVGPLRYQTDVKWPQRVLSDPLALLNDHAHLEKKAASNALDLLNRWPQNTQGPIWKRWVTELTGVARDEIDHLATVLRILQRRGGYFDPNHHNPYAAQLRQLVRLGKGPDELVDRLFVSALIELRSCERFELLGEHCDDAELGKLYRGLARSEHGHYLLFVNLAKDFSSVRDVENRWEQMLDMEAAIILQQPHGPRMHSRG